MTGHPLPSADSAATVSAVKLTATATLSLANGGFQLSLQRTLSIIKPDGVAQGNLGDILKRFEEKEFQIKALKMLHLSPQQAAGFLRCSPRTRLLPGTWSAT